MLHLVETADGSHTIRNDELNETYHSIHGAIQESKHVFIKHGLHYFIETKEPRALRILEVGFGTGLNALLTCLDENIRGVNVMYDTIEAFPLSPEIYRHLNYPTCLGLPRAQAILDQMHELPWDNTDSITSDFSLRKIHEKLQFANLQNAYYDIVYYDAFAPGKQPDIWRPEVLAHVIGAIKTGGILVTYCASGQLKRDLKTLHMEVLSLPGPPRKHEMVRATRQLFKRASI